ncbi:MAG: YdcF family protein [Proteobacteria bacterium]|nr:YdcF family protein [Pseudomonadota bacterium]
MRLGIVLALALIVAGPALAQSPGYRFAHTDNPVADADAYLLTLLAADPRARTAVAADPALSALGRRLAATREDLLKPCRAGAGCPVGELQLSDREVESAGDALARLSAPGETLAALVHGPMRASGRFQKYADLADPELIRAAFIETARGVNRAIRVYGLGEKPRYDQIDSISYALPDPHFRQMVREALETSVDPTPADLPFKPWSQFAFDLLAINQRDEAARYDPPGSVLEEKGENALAFARARRTVWTKAPYTAIVVPGMGAEEGETHLSPVGGFRVRLAVQRWREGKAPFLIVSGGHVHPNKTPYAEAIEMKKVLVRDYGVPAEAVFIDPYARHTTTNLRNAVRILFRAGAPMNRPMLITTSRDQSAFIEAPLFAQRNQAELGYLPVTQVKRQTTFDVSTLPNIVSLHADMTDPLDP